MLLIDDDLMIKDDLQTHFKFASNPIALHTRRQARAGGLRCV